MTPRPLTVGNCVDLSGGDAPAPRVLLRGADRRLLTRVQAAITSMIDETPETLADPARREVLEELLADVAEELGAKASGNPAEDAPKPRVIQTLNGPVEIKAR